MWKCGHIDLVKEGLRREKTDVDRETWNRVQRLLGDSQYQSVDLTYAGELIECGHCGHPITGERKEKQTKRGIAEYVYYRCTQYNKGDHPRTRLNEKELDSQVLALFDEMKIADDDVRDWFVRVLRNKTRKDQQDSQKQRAELQRQLTVAINQQD